MAKHDFMEYVCRPFCSFFREGVKEELACQGGVLVESMVLSGRLRPETLPAREQAGCCSLFDDPLLEAAVCRICPFRVDGCDFRAVEPPPNSVPCGGYILLAILLESGTISRSEMEGGTGE